MPSSRRPAKQLAYNWIVQELKKSKGADVGLDVACGYMQFKPFFQTKSYIGVDLDAERIELCKERYPDAISHKYSIEDMPPEITGDYVVCIQTIGANEFFNEDNTMLCIRKLVDATRENGSLVMTIGPSTASYFSEIDALLRDSFDEVGVREYGAFNTRLPSLVSRLVTYAMYVFSSLRKASPPRYLYACYVRNSTPAGNNQ